VNLPTVAAAAGCDRLRSRRQTCQCGVSGKIPSPGLRPLRRNAAQPDRSLRQRLQGRVRFRHLCV